MGKIKCECGSEAFSHTTTTTVYGYIEKVSGYLEKDSVFDGIGFAYDGRSLRHYKVITECLECHKPMDVNFHRKIMS